VTVRVPPAASVPRFQVTVPSAYAHPSLELIYIMPAGMMYCAMTLSAARFVLVLVTRRVYVTVSQGLPVKGPLIAIDSTGKRLTAVLAVLLSGP
jgi:hypothetical protein